MYRLACKLACERSCFNARDIYSLRRIKTLFSEAFIILSWMRAYFTSAGGQFAAGMDGEIS
jgi:hypothetical protein